MKVGKYTYKKSTRKGKKLMVTVKGKTIHFGDSNSEHYTDRSGIWNHKNHKDSKRRKNYLARAKGIKDGKGNKTWTDPTSSNYHSIKILW